jgi:hypothetical protein
MVAITPNCFHLNSVPSGFFLTASTALRPNLDSIKLISSVDKTNFDVEDSGVDGGIPYKQDKDPTVYPKRVTGFPVSSRFNNGLAVFPGSPEKFYQEYNPSREYVDEVGNGVLDLLFES